jgi:hypothetical protein
MPNSFGLLSGFFESGTGSEFHTGYNPVYSTDGGFVRIEILVIGFCSKRCYLYRNTRTTRHARRETIGP